MLRLYLTRSPFEHSLWTNIQKLVCLRFSFSVRGDADVEAKTTWANRKVLPFIASVVLTLYNEHTKCNPRKWISFASKSFDLIRRFMNCVDLERTAFPFYSRLPIAAVSSSPSLSWVWRGAPESECLGFYWVCPFSRSKRLVLILFIMELGTLSLRFTHLMQSK